MSGFERTWETFQRARTTMGPSPGVRESWRKGRSRYSLWALRVNAQPALERMQALQRALGAAIRPVPPTHAHVTVWVAGFPAERLVHDDDVLTWHLDQQLKQLTRGAPWPMRLELGPANSFLSCAVLEVHDPQGDLAALRGALGLWGTELRFADYQPHLTVGTYLKAQQTGPLVQAIAPLRSAPHTPLQVSSVELVELNAAVEGAPLKTPSERWRVPLG